MKWFEFLCLKPAEPHRYDDSHMLKVLLPFFVLIFSKNVDFVVILSELVYFQRVQDWAGSRHLAIQLQDFS